MPEQGPKPETRYAPHLALPSIGEEGQARIRSSRILLTGLGGLGCPTAQYLAASGVGMLTLCDFDRVHESNLARQVLYNPSDIGSHKVDIAHQRPMLCDRPEQKFGDERETVTMLAFRNGDSLILRDECRPFVGLVSCRSAVHFQFEPHQGLRPTRANKGAPNHGSLCRLLQFLQRLGIDVEHVL